MNCFSLHKEYTKSVQTDHEKKKKLMQKTKKCKKTIYAHYTLYKLNMCNCMIEKKQMFKIVL